MSARDLFALARDLRAAGVPYEPDLTWPLPVRHRSALYVALGHLCNRYEEHGPLGRRVLAALDWIDRVGARSRWASWFTPSACERRTKERP
jgi:hypothetical protein